MSSAQASLPRGSDDRHAPLLARLAARGRRLRDAQHDLFVLVKSAVQVFGIRLVGAALTYASMIVLARWLGAHDFGIYAYVSVVATLLGIALSFGFNSSALRFVASYRARNKIRRLAGYVRRSIAIVLPLSTLGAAAGVGLLFALRGFIEPYYFWPLVVGMLSVPVWTLLNQFESIARAFGWLKIAYVPGYILRPLLLVVFAAGFMLFGGRADAVAAVWAMIGACAVAALAQAVLVYRGVRAQLAGTPPAFHSRYWLTVSLGFLVIDGFRMLLDNTDVLLIGRFLDPHSVAIYFAVVRTCGFVAFVSFSITAFAVPKFSAIHSAGSREELQAFVSSTVQMMFWPSLAMAGALALAGPFVLALFGKGFEAGYPTMLVVLTGLVLRAAAGPVEHLLNATGHHREMVKVYGVAAAANVALNLVLIPTCGIVGAALASYAAMLGANARLYVLVKQRLGVSAFIWPVRTKPALQWPRAPLRPGQA